MAKTRISSTDLAWIFQEKLNAFDSCPPAVALGSLYLSNSADALSLVFSDSEPLDDLLDFSVAAPPSPEENCPVAECGEHTNPSQVHA
jgi:hypothetical protein